MESVWCVLQVSDVSQKLGASLQLGESIVSQTQQSKPSQTSKPVPNDADPTSMSALTSGQTDT